MEENKSWQEEVKEQTEKQIKNITKDQIQEGNIDYLGRLVDVQKDLKEMEENDMNYGRNYGRDSYGRYGNDIYGRRMRDSRGRYTGEYSENYGRRGVDSKYRGDDMLDEMHEHYGNYIENSNYGGPETMEALKYMLKSAEDFFEHIKNEAKSQEEIELVKQSARRISEM